MLPSLPCAYVIPEYPFVEVALPFFIICEATSAASFIGIAKPKPSTSEPLDFATTIPTRCPYWSKRPPPELPGFTDASVCKRLIVCPSIVTSRSSELIIPAVTVPPSSPRGLPITTDKSPTSSSLLLPYVAAVRLSASIFITAISVSESVPTRVASYCFSLESVTYIFEAPSITWLFVII